MRQHIADLHFIDLFLIYCALSRAGRFSLLARPEFLFLGMLICPRGDGPPCRGNSHRKGNSCWRALNDYSITTTWNFVPSSCSIKVFDEIPDARSGWLFPVSIFLPFASFRLDVNCHWGAPPRNEVNDVTWIAASCPSVSKWQLCGGNRMLRDRILWPIPFYESFSRQYLIPKWAFNTLKSSVIWRGIRRRVLHFMPFIIVICVLIITLEIKFTP